MTEPSDRLLESFEQQLVVTRVLEDGSPGVATGHRVVDRCRRHSNRDGFGHRPMRITRGSPQKPEAGFDPAWPLVVPRSCFSSGSFQSPCGQSRSSDGGSRPGLVEAIPDRSCGRLKGCQVSMRSLVGRVEADRCVKRSSDHVKGEAEFGLGDCQPLGELAIDSV